MKLIDMLLSLIAPHSCTVCGREGALLCAECISSEVLNVPSTCYMCGKVTAQYQTCTDCCKTTPLKQCYRMTYYDDPIKTLLRRYKFGRAYGGLSSIMMIMQQVSCRPAGDIVVTYVPTSPPHIRARGHDHARQMAKAFARVHKLEYASLLWSKTNHRQVGSNRKTRLSQVHDAYSVKTKRQYKDRTIIVFDDILTTGATLSAAVSVLGSAGYTKVVGAAFAQAGDN